MNGAERELSPENSVAEPLSAVVAALSSDVGLASLLCGNLLADPDSTEVYDVLKQLSETCERLICDTRSLRDLLDGTAEESAPPIRAAGDRVDRGQVADARPLLGATDVILDLAEQGAVVAFGRRLLLPRSEFIILNALLEKPDGLVSYEYLIGELWGEPYGQRRSRDLHQVVATLRRRLEPDTPVSYSRIQNIRGRGYRFVSYGRSRHWRRSVS